VTNNFLECYPNELLNFVTSQLVQVQVMMRSTLEAIHELDMWTRTGANFNIVRRRPFLQQPKSVSNDILYRLYFVEPVDEKYRNGVVGIEAE